MIAQIIFLPSLMLSGIMFPANLLPGVLESAGMIFPATWGFEIMTSTVYDFKLFIPLIALFVIAAITGAVKLKSM